MDCDNQLHSIKESNPNDSNGVLVFPTKLLGQKAQSKTTTSLALQKVNILKIYTKKRS